MMPQQVEKFWELSTRIYENKYIKNTKFGKLMGDISKKSKNLFINPTFAFPLLNLYLLAISYPNKDVNWAVRETLRTYGRAIRDMIMNSWEITELKKLDKKLTDLANDLYKMNAHSVLFPIHVDNDADRAKTYELIGLVFTSILPEEENKNIELLKEATKHERYAGIADINIVANIAREIFGAYDKNDKNNAKKCIDMLRSKNLESTITSFETQDNERIEVTPLDLIVLTFNDMLNTNVDTSFKFINKRLLANHTLRQMIYSLYARFFLDFILEFGPRDISRVLGFRIEMYLLDDVKEAFKGLSGNLRIADDVIAWQGEAGSQYEYVLKILNVGVKGEEIFDLWLEIRRDIGIAGMDSLIFIPMYPEQNLYGAWEKFNLDKRLAKVERRESEGNVVVLTLNHLYDLLRVMLINVDDRPEDRAFEVFEQIVKENLL